MLNKCIFCKFANDLSLIPNQFITDTKDDFVMLSANPQTNGHTLVIPKKHFSRLIDIPTKLQNKLFIQSIKVGEDLKKLLGAKAYIIKINNELYKLESSDKQHIGHIHFHIIPRYKPGEKISNKPKKGSTKNFKNTQSKFLK